MANLESMVRSAISIGGAQNQAKQKSESDRLYEMAQQNTQETFKFNANQAQQARDWQERMSNTSHQREVADLRASGLNPVLSANSGAQSYSASSASGQADSSAVGAIAQLYQTKMNNDNARQIAQMQNNNALNIAKLQNANNIQIAKINQATSNYASNNASAASRYASDNSSAASRYGAEQAASASRYNSDQHYAGNKYSTDRTKYGIGYNAAQGAVEGNRSSFAGRVGATVGKWIRKGLRYWR